MKSDYLIFGFLGVAVLILLVALGHRATHRAPDLGTLSTTPVQTAAAPVPPPAPGLRPMVQPTNVPGNPLQSGILEPIFYLQVKMHELRLRIQAAIQLHAIAYDDFEKLGFARDDAGGDVYNVFNPRGLVKFSPRGGEWIRQDVVDHLTVRPGAELVYNLRRRKADKQVTDTLYAIIPDFAKVNCGVAGGNKEYTLSHPIAIAPDNHALVEDEADMPDIDFGCVHTPDGKTAWFYKLKLRTRAESGAEWGSY